MWLASPSPGCCQRATEGSTADARRRSIPRRVSSTRCGIELTCWILVCPIMFTLDHVVPWGRSFDEYRRMFALTPSDLGGRIVGCGDGPARFNAEVTTAGAHVVSADPLYRWDAGQIRERIRTTYARVLDQTRKNAHQFVWNTIGSVEELGTVRMKAMCAFLNDYASPKTAGRYVGAELPGLPFRDSS